MMSQLVQLAYLVATALFIFALYWMNDPKTARKGVYAGVAAMAIGILGTVGLLAGFESIRQEGITLPSDFTATINVDLKVEIGRAHV